LDGDDAAGWHTTTAATSARVGLGAHRLADISGTRNTRGVVTNDRYLNAKSLAESLEG